MAQDIHILRSQILQKWRASNAHILNFSLFLFSSLRTKLNYNPPKDDGSTYKIELEGISVDIMKEILDYIFSGQVWQKNPEPHLDYLPK